MLIHFFFKFANIPGFYPFTLGNMLDWRLNVCEGGIWVTTVIHFECHVHLNMISFSSTPCFHLLQLPPLQNKPFWIYIWDFPFSEWLAGKSELWRKAAFLRSALCHSTKSKLEEWTSLLFGIHAALPVDASCPLHRAGIQAKLVYGQNASYPRPWIFDAGARHFDPMQYVKLYSVCVSSILLLVCISGCKWLQQRRIAEHNVTCVRMRNCTISSGFPLQPWLQVLSFHPTVWDHKLNNLTGAASEGIYKQRGGGLYLYRSPSVAMWEEKGQSEKEQMRCSASCKTRP